MTAAGDQIVHYVLEPGLARDPEHPCVNAVISGTDRAYGDHDRDLTVFRADGPLTLRDVRWDGDPSEAETGTWHFRQFCPFGSWTRPHRSGPFLAGEDARREALRAEAARLGLVTPAANWHEPPLTPDQQDLLNQLIGNDPSVRRPFGVVRSLFPDLPGRTVTIGNVEIGDAGPVLSYLALTVTSGDPVWVLDPKTGAAEVVIIPAADWHAPGTCCCKHCPWQGNHGER